MSGWCWKPYFVYHVLENQPWKRLETNRLRRLADTHYVCIRKTHVQTMRLKAWLSNGMNASWKVSKHPGSILEAFWTTYCPFLEASWTRLDASWTRLEVSARRLKVSCQRLEASLRCLASVLRRLGGVLKASWGVLEASWTQIHSCKLLAVSFKMNLKSDCLIFKYFNIGGRIFWVSWTSKFFAKWVNT